MRLIGKSPFKESLKSEHQVDTPTDPSTSSTTDGSLKKKILRKAKSLDIEIRSDEVEQPKVVKAKKHYTLIRGLPKHYFSGKEGDEFETKDAVIELFVPVDD